MTADPPRGSAAPGGVPPVTDAASAPPNGRAENGLDLSSLLPDNLSDLAAAESARIDGSRPDSAPTSDLSLTKPLSIEPTAGSSAPVELSKDGTVTERQDGTAAGQQDAPEAGPPTIWQQMGGPMGMVDSGLPVVVFIVANAIGGLGWGIGAALGAAVVIAIMRIARKRPVTQAVAGLFGVGIAAFIAYKTDSAKGYFLLGIWSYLLYGGALLLSILVRWPLIGVIWEGINGKGTGWRSDRKLVRRYDWATFVWVVVFAARYLVQNYLYDTDQVGWLAAVRLLMGYPVFIIAIAVSVWIVAGGSAVKLPESWRRDRRSEGR